MGSFPKLRSKNASAQLAWQYENPVSRSLFRHPTPREQRTLAPKSDDSQFLGYQGTVDSIHLLVPFPHNHLHLFRILYFPSPQICDRFADRELANILSQPTRHHSPVLAKRPDDHRCRHQDVFATNRNALRRFHVDSPLTDEATEAIYKSHNLHDLSVVIEKGTPRPSESLPNLTHLQIECEDRSDGLQLLRGAKLEFVNFNIKSGLANDFLEAFKEAALSSSSQNTLSAIYLFTEWPWNPNYTSLLPFTRLACLKILFSCDEDCSGMDDNVLIDLSRLMPNLQELCLGPVPCRRFSGGATTKGLVALAHNCPDLSSLRVHFQAAGLSDSPTGLETTRDAEHSGSWTGCALTDLDVGHIPVPEGSASMIALTLLRIFPRIETIDFEDEAWSEVADMIWRSKETIDCSSTYHHPAVSRKSLLTLLRSQSYDR